MTSQERHERRYQRRKAKREAKRAAAIGRYDDFERLSSISALIRAHWEAQRGVMWKASPVRYDSHYLRNSVRYSRYLLQGKDTRQGFYSFTIYERGKRRDVHSLHYAERVIRRSVCINGLVPILSHSLIYDNGASLQDKGVAFSIRRCEAHLHEYYRRYGNTGYVLVIDYKSFFDNIRHDHLFDVFDKHIKDERLREVCRNFVTATGRDGLYIGPEDSQISAIAYPNDIDHIIKDQWQQPFYNRYMDDSYIICPDKERLLKIRNDLFKLFADRGIIPNPKKTQIVKLSRGFTFLKMQFILQDNGHLIRKPCRANLIRERRKLKSFRRFVDEGIMTAQYVSDQYVSWRGCFKHKDAHRSLCSLDKYFTKLFAAKPWIDQKRSEPEWTRLIVLTWWAKSPPARTCSAKPTTS